MRCGNMVFVKQLGLWQLGKITHINDGQYRVRLSRSEAVWFSGHEVYLKNREDFSSDESDD